MLGKMPAAVEENEDLVVVDGVCRLCSAWMIFVLKRDPRKRFKFAFFQSKTGEEILHWLDMPPDRYETLIYLHRGKAFFRSSAFLKIIVSLGKGWRLLALGFLLPGGIRDWLYDRIAVRRYQLFGKQDACSLPDPDIRDRLV